MIVEEAYGYALMTGSGAVSLHNLNREEKDFAVARKLDEKTGDRPCGCHPFEKIDLVGMEVVYIEPLALSALCVVEDRAPCWSDSAAIIRLGFRFGNEIALLSLACARKCDYL